jgi:hypothetical protein
VAAGAAVRLRTASGDTARSFRLIERSNLVNLSTVTTPNAKESRLRGLPQRPPGSAASVDPSGSQAGHPTEDPLGRDSRSSRDQSIGLSRFAQGFSCWHPSGPLQTPFSPRGEASKEVVGPSPVPPVCAHPPQGGQPCCSRD